MQTEKIIKKLDLLFRQNNGYEAQKLLEDSIQKAKEEQDQNALLIFYNEIIGLKRETSQALDSYAYAEEALALMQHMDLAGTRPYATTLLNIANAYRAGGKLEDSLELYKEVLSLYPGLVPKEDMLFASLNNNISLLYQEMGDFRSARDYLLKALTIVKQNKDTAFEEAVTYSNLAAACLQIEEEEEAKWYFTEAIRLFEEQGVRDAHYAAALSSQGTYLYKKAEFLKAADCFTQAMACIKASLGENDYYRRLLANLTACRSAAGGKTGCDGLYLCHAYYETYGKPMIHKDFPEYEGKIAVGLVGEGSDCFGYDDDISRDHDWGPGFCMWVSDEVFKAIGVQLQEAYDRLPKEFMGYTRRETPQGKDRMGLHTIDGFYRRLLGENNYKRIGDMVWKVELDLAEIPDEALAAAVNGEVFADGEGTFSAIRQQLKAGFPERMRYLKLAEACAKFSQGAQYNFRRMAERKDQVAAALSLTEGLRHAMKLMYYANREYPPHEKWLYRGILEKSEYAEKADLIQKIIICKDEKQQVMLVEKLAENLCNLLYERNFISIRENYLDYHTTELFRKSALCEKSDEELVEAIAETEYDAFDKVRNEGGRASCQNDWYTFSRMRKSQYMTWNRTMLLQYLYDFQTEYEKGHNMIEEKYGRMMESTAPLEYAKIADRFPAISKEKKQIIEAIVQIQVSFMEEFAKKYPHLAENARTIHTREDSTYDTSYETYLRGEISTYSDKMLELYGRFVAELASSEKNLAALTIENSVHLYGYKSLEDVKQ
ncbi:MAG TPA: DUF4125 family protein [Lachnospiraceae bacterium]|nr:DUF4125 family protein [Lachnospiraceae bacterium]